MRTQKDLFSNGSNSLSSLSLSEIDQEALPTLDQLLSRAPNVAGLSAGGRSLGNVTSIRGVGNSLQFSASSVNLYLDGVPLYNSRGYPSTLIDPVSVKVYRGPQVTSFGMPGEAGTLEIETVNPSKSWEGYSSASYGTANDQRYLSTAGGSLAKDVYGQFGGFYAQSDGNVYNPVTDNNIFRQQSFGGQAKILWKPQKDTELAFLFWIEKSNDGTPGVGAISPDPLVYPADLDGDSQNFSSIAALRFRHEEETWKLSAVVSGQWWQLDPWRIDFDYSASPVFNQNIPAHENVWLGEVVASSKGDLWQETTWKTGLSGAWNHIDFENRRNFPGLGFQDLSRQKIENQNISVFGQISIPVQERLRFWVGTRVGVYFEQASQSYAGPLIPNITQSGSKSSLLPLPDVGMEFKASEDTILYAKATGGSKPSGFVPFAATPSLSGYDSEFMINGEIGLKQTWPEQHLTLQTAAFYYHMENYQFESFLSTGSYSIYNIPETEGYGGELELLYSPIESLELGVGAGVTRTSVIEGVNPSTGLSIEGKQVPYAPLFSASAHATWRPWKGIMLFGEGLAVGETSSDLNNTGAFTQASYALMNLKVGYEWEHCGVYFYANNVTDTRYYSNILPNFGLAGAAAVGDPQSIGVQVVLQY